MSPFLRENSWPVALSVLLHGLLAGGVVLMAYLSNERRLPTVEPYPIDAMVVDSRVLRAAQRSQAEAAEQAVARAQAAEAVRVAAAAAATAEADAAAAAAKTAADEKAAAADDARRAAEARKALEAKEAVAEAKQAADARAAADAKRAAAAAEAEAKAAAAAKQQAALAKQIADSKRAADERAKQDREAELRRQLADEEHVSAVESGPLRDKYIAMLRNKIQNAWIKPPAAIAGIDCQVQVTQVPGGEVTAARVTQCNGDASVRQSIENAVYRAAPLPDPPDPALFERNIVLRFKPND